MEFELSVDQLALQEAANDLLARRADPAAVRRVVDGGGGWDPELWGHLVEQGWPALLVPEDLGGVGLGWVEAAVLVETTGRHVAPTPILGQLVATDAMVAAGDSTWLDRLAAGEALAAVATRSLEAERRGAGWSLTGTTEPVAFAPSADVLVVPGNTADGRRLFLVECANAGPEALESMDLTREFGRYTFDSESATELGGADAAAAHLDRGATAMAAEMLGCASAALDMSVEHARDREQFGRPIGSFQAVKHRCADMLVDVEGMRSASWWAAWALASGDPERSAAASTAKIWCSDAAERVLTSALQVHGGIGFTWESDLHLYLKRIEYDRRAFGTAAEHRDRLADHLREQVRAGRPVI
ncbi:MAG: acyl-CoA dehydrogenase [Actinomycetia bacterium]|nr:acyl-CoA dehydrogenase [Actinomycetes bacterium]